MQFATMKKQQKASPNRVAFVTLNEKYNGFRIDYRRIYDLILVGNGKFFSAFGSSAGQNFTAVSR